MLRRPAQRCHSVEHDHESLDVDVHLDGSGTGLVYEERHFSVHVRVTILAGYSEFRMPALPRIAMPGSSPTGETFTTIDCTLAFPRVEVHPVVPVPQVAQLPPRPPERRSVPPGVITQYGKAVALRGDLPLNTLPNPSLIPILDPEDPDFKDRAARLAVTYFRPWNLDKSLSTWTVKSGPVVLCGSRRGLTVLAYATEDSDELAEIEVRWDGDTGQLLCVFRAFVGHVRKIPFRANIICGTTKLPRARPKDVKEHVAQANVLLYQAGLLLQADPDPTTFDGAVPHADCPGIFTISTTDEVTGKADYGKPVAAMRMNWRPGILTLLYIKSFKDKKNLAGSATDRPGLTEGYLELTGSPTTSWVCPSGVAPDKAARSVRMRSLRASPVRGGEDDLAYVAARGLPAASLEKMWGPTLVDYTTPDSPDWGQTLAHEVCHVLGLRHRGNGATSRPVPGSDDDINDPHGKGHPWRENVMCYGYRLSQDIDLIQTKCIRNHPLTKAFPHGFVPPPPKAPDPGVGGPAARNPHVATLQIALGDLPADGIYDLFTGVYAQSQMVHRGSRGSVVLWTQDRLTAEGFDCGIPDAQFGSKTEKSVRAYQRSVGLKPDGIVDPQTMRKLAGVP